MVREAFKQPEDTRPRVAVRNISARLVSVEGIDFKPGDVGEISRRTFDKLTKDAKTGKPRKGIAKIFGPADAKMLGDDEDEGLPSAEEMADRQPRRKKKAEESGDPESLDGLSVSEAMIIVAKSESVEDLKRWAGAEGMGPRLTNAITARLDKLGAT